MTPKPAIPQIEGWGPSSDRARSCFLAPETRSAGCSEAMDVSFLPAVSGCVSGASREMGVTHTFTVWLAEQISFQLHSLIDSQNVE
jgi:hypothetical protein